MDSLMGLAALASGEEPYQAIGFLAAAEVQSLAMGFKLAPLSQRLYDEAFTRTRATLSEAEFAAAWAKGQAMSLDEVVTLALAFGVV